MVKTTDITYRYPGSVPLSFPDLRVEAGHALLISGESGCGKTTLLHILAGLRRPTSGQVIIEDKKMADLPPKQLDQFRGQHIGIVHQQPYFIESLSIWDNLIISPYTSSKGKAKAIAERLYIRDILNRYPNQLSMGQQQRVTIARSVMNSPKLILADEPTSALDNKNCTYVIDLLLEEALANNAALIVVSHDDRLRSEISDRIELNANAN